MEATIDNREFFQLRDLVREAGLFEERPGFYIRQALIVLIFSAVSFGVLVIRDSFWLQMMNAALLALTDAQGGLLMHSIGHGQVHIHPLWRPFVYGCLNLRLCWDTKWWVVNKHGIHHNNPNNPLKDPDVIGELVSFSFEQAKEKRGLKRFITRFQHWFIVPLLLFEAEHLRAQIVVFLSTQHTKEARRSLGLMVVHATLYLGALFLFLPFWHAVAFVLVHQGLLGFGLGTDFLTNHIGMPVVGSEDNLDRLRMQVTTARNIRVPRWATPLMTWYFGGLNFQIEHHIFPAMPIPNYSDAAVIVERFCSERGVPYESVSLRKAYRDVFVCLRGVGRSVT